MALAREQVWRAVPGRVRRDVAPPRARPATRPGEPGPARGPGTMSGGVAHVLRASKAASGSVRAEKAKGGKGH